VETLRRVDSEVSDCDHAAKKYTGTLYIDPLEHTWECPCGARGREVDEKSRKDYNRRMKGFSYVGNK
jgi:hypothetical protein